MLESGEVVKHAAEGPNVDWVAVELDSICNRPKDAPQFKLRKRFFFIPSLFDYLREGIGTFEKSPRAAYYITI